MCMHGGVIKRFWNFEGTEQGNTTSLSAALDLSVPLSLVFDGCNKNLVGNRLRHVILNTHLSASVINTSSDNPPRTIHGTACRWSSSSIFSW
jgi:hypothetical protein